MGHRVIALAWLVGASLVGSAAHAGDDKKPVDPGDAKVCIRPPTTGSRIRPQPICRTKREWDIADRQQRDGMEKVMREFTHPQQSSGPF